MNSLQRIQELLAGGRPDRPPFSFWHHFPADQVAGEAAVRSHLRHLEEFNLDFLKVMNDNPYPHPGGIGDAGDLKSIKELRGDEGGYGRQLELLVALQASLRGRVMMTTTVFNAWAVLRHLVRPPKEHNPPDMRAEADESTRKIKSFYAQDPQAVKSALEIIAANLARFARRCLDSGAAGIYLSVRDDWLEISGGSLYDELVRPNDIRILEAVAGGSFNILHVCGRPVDFRRFAGYPVHVIHWADRAAGPPIARVKEWVKPVICAGVDNLSTLPHGSPEDVEREVADALAQAGSRPIIIAPGCTYSPQLVPAENLKALARAATGFRYPA